MNKYKSGLIYAFVASLISGVSIFLNKFAVDAVKSPILLTTSKNVFVGVAFIGLLVFIGKWRKVSKLSAGDIFKLVLVALVGGSLPFYLFFTGLANTSGVNAAIIQKTLVIWVAVFAAIYLKEKISIVGILSVILLFLGNTYVGGFKGFSFSNGELMILVATVFWSVESVIVKKILKNIDVEIVSAFRMGVGSLILLSFMSMSNQNIVASMYSLSAEQLFWIGITSILLFSYVLAWYKAISKAPVVTVTAVLVISTLITNVLSAVFVTHTWTESMMMQAAVISIGVFLGYVSLSRLTKKAQDVAIVGSQ